METLDRPRIWARTIVFFTKQKNPDAVHHVLGFWIYLLICNGNDTDFKDKRDCLVGNALWKEPASRASFEMFILVQMNTAVNLKQISTVAFRSSIILQIRDENLQITFEITLKVFQNKWERKYDVAVMTQENL